MASIGSMTSLDVKKVYQLLARQDVEEISAFLEASGLDIADQEGRTFLMIAAVDASPELVEALILLGCDAELQDQQGFTALHLAVINKRREIINLLLDHGVAVDTRDKWGNTSLWRAAMVASDSEEASVRALVSAGADLDAQNFHGVSPRKLLA